MQHQAIIVLFYDTATLFLSLDALHCFKIFRHKNTSLLKDFILGEYDAEIVRKKSKILLTSQN